MSNKIENNFYSPPVISLEDWFLFKSTRNSIIYTDSGNNNSSRRVYKIPRAETRKAIESEFEKLCCVCSEYVVRSYGIVTNKGLMALSLEKFGIPLSQANISSLDMRNVLKQIVLGLCDIHSVNIVHGDIKPDNILVENERVKLCDLGISRYIGTSLRPGGELASPAFRSPEMISCNLKLENKSAWDIDFSLDIWGFGCLIYYLITDKYPFVSEDRSQLGILYKTICRVGKPSWVTDKTLEYIELKFGKINSEKDWIPWQIESDKDLLDLFMKCLSPDASSRPTIEEILDHDYFAIDV